MHNFIYASVDRLPFTADQRLSLIKLSRAANERIGVTGVLLYRDGRFIQALEGEEAAVLKLADTIKSDPRHSDFVVLYSGSTDTRHFPDWSMGYCDLTQTPPTQVATDLLIQSMLAGTASATTPGEGARLIRAMFRAFAVEASRAA